MRLLFTIGVAVCLRTAQAGGEVIHDFDLAPSHGPASTNYPASATSGWARVLPPDQYSQTDPAPAFHDWVHKASPTDVPAHPTYVFDRANGPFKPRYDKWGNWRNAANKNKQLHWDVIMGTMYNSHIEKEQKTLERLSRDVQSQLNSMYLGKASKKGCQIRRTKNYHSGGNSYTYTPTCDSTTPHGCADQGKGDSSVCSGCGDGTMGKNPFCKWNGLGHEDSPIQISMRDTKEAYEELVKCLKNSIKNTQFASYLELAQSTMTSGGSIKVEAIDGNDYSTDALKAAAVKQDGGFNKDAHIVRKTEQAHYNLESSYKCSNEEMHFEVRLYKMSKLENRYKLLYLYCKCDLTTQIRKFAKMVETLCGAGATGNFKTGHCYTSGSREQNNKYYAPGKRADAGVAGASANFEDFMAKIKISQCDLATEFCPEHVFYYRDDGVGAHPAGDCSTCKDFGGDHSRITGTGNHRYANTGDVNVADMTWARTLGGQTR